MTSKERVEYTDEDGASVRGEKWLVDLWIQIGKDRRTAEQQWIADLRSIGIKAAHPDDGHVDRKRSEYHDFVSFCYPQFNDGVKAGDKIALGWPDRYRVRVVQVVQQAGFLWKREEYQVTK